VYRECNGGYDDHDTDDDDNDDDSSDRNRIIDDIDVVFRRLGKESEEGRRSVQCSAGSSVRSRGKTGRTRHKGIAESTKFLEQL
jgi:hypothetical protein